MTTKREKLDYLIQIIKNYFPFGLIILGSLGFAITFRVLINDIKWDRGESRFLSKYHNNTVLYIADTLNSSSNDSLTIYGEIQISSEDILQKTKPIMKFRNTENKERMLEQREIFFNLNPTFMLWIVIMSLMIGTSACIILPVITIIYDFNKKYDIDLRKVLIVIVLLILFGIGFVSIADKASHIMSIVDSMEKFDILLNNPRLIRHFKNIAIIVGIFVIFAQLVLSLVVPKIKSDEKKVKIIVSEFSELNTHLKFLLLCNSVLIVFSIVTTAMIRKSIHSLIDFEELKLIPIEFVYGYGLFFTIVLALFYLPIYFQLKYKGKELLKEITKRHELKGDQGLEFVNTLCLKGAWLDNLKVGVYIGPSYFYHFLRIFAMIKDLVWMDIVILSVTLVVSSFENCMLNHPRYLNWNDTCSPAPRNCQI